ncbi:MAG: hypothetical protein D8M53_05010 [Armatimonadetes bacterium]|nr:hypothetical protein [Armatimonadota bacterium]
MDKQGEMLMPEALYALAEQANAAYIPMWVEHDVARPPIGRMISAKVIRLDDGVLAVEATGEVWESDADLAAITSDGRRMVIHETQVPTFQVGFDTTFHDPEGMELVKELREAGCASSQFEGRKSAEVVSQLVIAAGAFIAGAISGGFFNALGEELYSGLKSRLKALRKKKDKSGKERATRLLFRFTVRDRDRSIEVNAVLDNATDEMIESFFDSGIKQLDAITTEALALEPRATRIATRQTADTIEPIYVARDDCKPSWLRREETTDDR